MKRRAYRLTQPVSVACEGLWLDSIQWRGAANGTKDVVVLTVAGAKITFVVESAEEFLRENYGGSDDDG